MLTQVMALCDEARHRTGGWFGPHGLPDPHLGGPRHDPSGLVKGRAVEQAARHLNTLDGYGWCLNAGGDVLVHAPAGRPVWRIGVEHPDDPARIMHVVERRTGAVATSGSAHIIDPHTSRAVLLQHSSALPTATPWPGDRPSQPLRSATNALPTIGDAVV